jgi:uncharacterized protein (DUF1697 family)
LRESAGTRFYKAADDTAIESATYVALLRGINVGGNSLVSMKALKSCFEELGFQDVKTYINSGNIIFKDSRKSLPGLVKLIESGIKAHRKMDIRVIVKSKDDIAAICKKIPAEWVTDTLMRTDVMFLWDDVDTPEMVAAVPSNPKVDRLLHVKGALIWNVARDNYGKKQAAEDPSATPFYKNMTARNANTTRKLLELMSNDLA